MIVRHCRMRQFISMIPGFIFTLGLAGCCTAIPTGMTGGIPVIDTHIHLYDTTRAGGVPWPKPSDQVLYRPMLPKHYDKVTRANGVTATVIVEASDRVEDVLAAANAGPRLEPRSLRCSAVRAKF